ncbi:MAG: hypothetical protein QG670_999 [Thermoproteota archaeon]|nr:hypothetical protein [Thermoproteota archaeon]
MSTGFELFMALESGFSPTPEEVARKMMEVAHLKRGEVFYDLGSGDGTLLIIAAKEFGACAIGIEIQEKLVKDSRKRIRSLNLGKMIRVVKGDYFKADIRDANVLTLYLIPEALERLKLKLTKELRKGARIVVYKYPMEGWTPKEVHETNAENAKAKVFLYQM